MKKLIIAAAVVCAAVVTQAATCAWNSGYFGFTDFNPDYSAYDNYTFNYAIVCLGDTAVDASTLSYDGTTVKMGDKTLTAIASGTGVDGYGQVGNIGDDVVAGKYYTMLIYSNDSDLYGVGSQVVATHKTVPGAEQDYELMKFSNVSFKVDGGTNSGIMATESIPEPTSGLLLLLGVAGLALRRRRA